MAMASRSLTRSLFGSFVCDACRCRGLNNQVPLSRSFSNTSSPRADSATSSLGSLGSLFGSSSTSRSSAPSKRGGPSGPSLASILDGDESALASFSRLPDMMDKPAPHRFHVYATKHNTHITFVQPSKTAAQTTSSSISATTSSAAQQNKMIDTLLSLSTGNIGFTKSGRGTYDAAYQLTAYVLKTMKEKGMLQGCTDIEVVLRGFGPGREAATKAILSSEGRDIRPRIRAVMDATRLKQGGPRSPRPRRLG